MLRYHFIRGQIKRFFGAVRSGEPAAYLGIFLKAVGPFTRLSEQINSPIFLNKHNDEKEALPPCLMIVSPPRSGSTVIYQVLVRVIPSVYLSNLHFLFPTCASSYLLRNNLFGTNLGGFHNYYGYTSSIYDVNEGNEIVASFFQGDADHKQIRQRFIRFVKNMQATPEHPLIFKNVRGYSNILRLHRAVPEIIFLRIRRNLEQTIQSVLRAYYELGTFHPIPETLWHCNINDPIEFSVRQVMEIEREINDQLRQIQPSNRLEWWYEDFCAETSTMIQDLVVNYLKLDPSCLRHNTIAEPLKVSNRVKVNANEAARISLLLQQYRNNIKQKSRL